MSDSELKVKVPSLGESITEATVLTIHKAVGDFVDKDDLITELETQKVTMEVRASHAGKITSIHVSEGQTVEIGQDVVTIDTQNVSSINNVAESFKKDNSFTNVPQPSPSASRMAEEASVSFTNIIGSGKRGQVLKEDVIKSMEKIKISLSGSSQQKNNPGAKKIATNTDCSFGLQHDSSTSQSCLFDDVDVTALLQACDEYSTERSWSEDSELSLVSFFAYAAARAIPSFPSLNCCGDKDTICESEDIDMSISVLSEIGVISPLIRAAKGMSAKKISLAIRGFKERAINGELSPSDIQAGTFSICYDGEYGAIASFPAVPKGNSAIMSVGRLFDRVVIDKNEEVKKHDFIRVCISYNHNIVRRQDAVMFLSLIRKFIETPYRLFIGD